MIGAIPIIRGDEMTMRLLTELLDLPHVRVVGYELPDEDTIVLDIEFEMPVAMCPGCQKISSSIHSYVPPRMVRDLDMWNRQCYLRFRPRQFECDECENTFVERLAWLEKSQRQTRRMERRVFELVRRTNVADAAWYHRSTDEVVEALFLREARRRLEARGFPQVEELNVDEISIVKGGGQYVLVISSPEVGVLDVLPNRLKATLEAWFDERGPAWCAAVKRFNADMWAPYHAAARAKLPNVKTIADHFHVIQGLNDALASVRRTLQRHADEATRSRLKGSRWLLVKNQESLSEADQERLAQILQVDPILTVCYQLKEAFRDIYKLTDAEQASQSLEQWLECACEITAKPFPTFVTTVQNWRKQILNFFHNRSSNGFAEGVNTKIKLIRRRAYGCPNFQHFRLRVLIAFGT
jgi:transposase